MPRDLHGEPAEIVPGSIMAATPRNLVSLALYRSPFGRVGFCPVEKPEETPMKPKRISRWENLQNGLKNPTDRLALLRQAFEGAPPALAESPNPQADTKTTDPGQKP